MKEKWKILARRFELATNAISGALTTGAFALMVKDGGIVVDNNVFALVLFLLGLATYCAATWVLMEISDYGYDSEDVVD